MALKRSRKAPLIDTSSIGSAFGSILLKGFELFNLGGEALSELADNAQKRVAAIAFKVGVLLILLLWVSVGILLTLLGLFFLLIDQAGIARGLVFGAGGAILALVALLLLKFAKQNADTADL